MGYYDNKPTSLKETQKLLKEHWASQLSYKNIWEWLEKETNIPYLRLDIEIPWKEIYKEALAVKDQCVIHREFSGGGTWKSGCLHGIRTDVTNDWEHLDEFKDIKNEPKYKWTELSDQCPVTTKYFKEVFPFAKYKRLRFMWVEPGGYILPHSDNDERCLSPVNISIYNPEDCEFRYKNWGKIPFINGSAFLIDVGQDHAVWNNSNESRLHIIAHGKRKSTVWRQLLLKSWEKYGYGCNKNNF